MNNKPLSMIIEETKTKLAAVCNDSGLTPVILDLIMQNIYNEVRNLSKEQVVNEKTAYEESFKTEINNKKVDGEIEVIDNAEIVE